jgi:TATA-binding protein-associated factor
MAYALYRIHTDCVALLHQFVSDCKLPSSSIPFLGTEVDITGSKPDCFTVTTAQTAIGSHFTRLKDSLGRAKKKELAAMGEKRSAIVISIERYLELKTQHDTRVSAAFAAAFVAFKSTPDKVSPVVKGIMNGIKVLLSCVECHPSLTYILLFIERREFRLANSFCCCCGCIY